MPEPLHSSRDLFCSAQGENEAAYRLIFEQSPYPMWIYALGSLKFLEVNEAAIQVYGYSRSEFLAMGIVALHPDHDQLPLKEICTSLQQTDSAASELWQHRCKDGTIIDVQTTSQAIIWSGIPARCVHARDITVQKRTEEYLRQSESRLKTVQRVAQIGIWEFDLTTHQIFWSEETFQICGVDSRSGPPSFEDLMSRIIHPDDRDLLLSQINHACITGESYNIDLRITLPGDMIRYTQGIGEAIRNRQGHIVGLRGTIQDISDRKRAEIALKENAERQKAITRIVEQIRQTLDLTTLFNRTAQAVQQLLACDRVLIYQFDTDWNGQFVAEAVTDGWVSALNHREELDLLQHNINQCSRQFSPSFPDSYLRHLQNTAPSEIRNFVQSDIYQAGFSDCYLHRLEHLQARAYAIAPIFQADQVWGLLAAYQNSAPRLWKDTEIELLNQIGAQISIAVQQAELFTQIQQQKIDLEIAKDKAEAANTAKGQFLANMSHELRTPLNAILGFAQLLSQDSSLSPTHINHLKIILQSSEHLLELINDVLEMARIDSGHISLTPSDFDLYNLLHDLHYMLGLRAAHKNLNFTLTYEPDVPQFIRADESKLRQILINLLGNALKFTQSGSIALRVSLRDNPHPTAQQNSPSPEQQTSDLHLQFEIQDTGPGIATTDLDKLFVPFMQADAGIKSGQGTGLGLTISQRFIHLMGGEITVTSEVGLGSTFCFWIQAESSKLKDLPFAHPSGALLKLIPGHPPYRILIVDDQEDTCHLVTILLRDAGFETAIATNGHEAIAQWQSWQPHLILMDMQMPVMDGYTASQYIREREQSASATKIIALTASAFEEQRALIFAAGCDAVLYKPFHAEDLLFALVNHLGASYTYEERPYTPSYPTPHTTPMLLDEPSLRASLNFENLSIMPPNWHDQLQRAARNLSMTDCLSLIDQIPQAHNELAHSLMILLDNFQFELLLKILNEELEKQTD